MVEYLHPGVYVTEIAFTAKPIEGVFTSPAPVDPASAVARDAQGASTPEPDWTQHNDSDPGVTLVQLFASLSESSLFGAQPQPAARAARALTGRGVVQGLGVEGRDPGGSGDLKVSPGLALATDGRPIVAESATAARRVWKP